MALAGLLAAVPWGVVGVVAGAVLGHFSVELLTFVIWTAAGVLVGLATATTPPAEYGLAVRAGCGIGSTIGIIWGIYVVHSAGALAMTEPFDITRLGAQLYGSGMLALSTIFSTAKGATIGALAVFIARRFLGQKES